MCSNTNFNRFSARANFMRFKRIILNFWDFIIPCIPTGGIQGTFSGFYALSDNHVGFWGFHRSLYPHRWDTGNVGDFTVPCIQPVLYLKLA